MMKHIQTVAMVVVALATAMFVTGCGTTAAVKLGGYDDARSASERQNCNQQGYAQPAPTGFIGNGGGYQYQNSRNSRSSIVKTRNGTFFNDSSTNSGMSTPLGSQPYVPVNHDPMELTQWEKMELANSMPAYVEPPPTTPKPPIVVKIDPELELVPPTPEPAK
jgi:hypothetical protein